jgi:peptidoglycan/xylan/chitin deacetylase (PgdA/CDA1 family)
MKKVLVLFSAAGVILGLFCALIFLPKNLPSKIKQKTTAKVTTIPPTPTPLPDFCFDAPVLFYHHIQPFDKAEDDNQRMLTVAPANFEAHIRYLKSKGYELVPLEKIVDALLNRKNPGKVAAIVLDDGYTDNYLYAYPIAKRNDVPINIAMVTGFASSYNQLSWGQIKVMVDSGFVYILNHSWSHQSLHGTNSDTIFKQVTVAQEQLEKHIPGSRKIFIYPYGRTGESVINILKEQKFDAAFTDQKGIQQCLSQRYTLPRLRTGNFHLSVHGL